MCKLLVFVLLAAAAAASDKADLGHGMQILGKVLRQYLKSQPDDVKISDGVHLVSVRGENDARAATDDKSVLGVVENYLQTHELRIRLPELMPGEEFGRAFKDAMDNFDKNSQGTARGGGEGGGGGGFGGGKKGGGGEILLMGMMMAKMMGAMKMMAIGGLAMKALMVSAIALMLSIIIGLKKLVHSGHDEGGHTVIHASHGHHDYRKKREAADMAYSGWSAYSLS